MHSIECSRSELISANHLTGNTKRLKLDDLVSYMAWRTPRLSTDAAKHRKKTSRTPNGLINVRSDILAASRQRDFVHQEGVS